MTTPDAADHDDDLLAHAPTPDSPKKRGYRGPSAAGICAAAAIVLVGLALGINPFGPILGVIARDLGITSTGTPAQGTSGDYSVTTQEALYLSRLAADGVPYHDPAATITVGRQIGTYYDQGYTPDQIAGSLTAEFEKYGNPYTAAQIRSITWAGIANFGTRQRR